MSQNTIPEDNPQQGGGISFKPADILENTIYYWRVFLIVFAVVLTAGSFYALFSTPIYTADVLIQIESAKKNAIGGAIGGAASANLDPTAGMSSVGTEMAIFSSRNVISRAVESQFLHTTIKVDNRFPLISGLIRSVLPTDDNGLTIAPFGSTDYAWGGEELLFDTFVIPSRYQLQELILKVGEDNNWTLYDQEGRQLAQGHGTELYATDDSLWKIKIQLLKARSGAEFAIVRYPVISRIGQLAGGLKLVDPVRGGSLIRATFDHPDPFFATKMINALADAYVEQNTERKAEEADKTLVFLKTLLPDLQDKADTSASQFAAYQESKSLPDVSAEIKAQIDRSINIDVQIAEANVKRQEILQRYGPLHPAVRGIDGVLAQLKSDKQEITNNLSTIPKEQLEFAKLLSRVEVDKQLYINLRNYQQQLEVSKAGTVGNVYIIDRAVVPGYPSKPKKDMIVAASGIIGLILGILAAHLFAALAGKIRDPKKLEASTGIKTLSVLPFAVEQEVNQVNNGNEPFLLAKENPNATLVEALRSLRIALQFALVSKPRRKIVLITSAVPSQGKSFISANLAYLIAAGGKRVLLVDADIRKTSLSNYYDIRKRDGLSEYLEGSLQIDQTICTMYPNLDVIPAGQHPHNPGELFVEDQFTRIIECVSDRYDLIVIDSPPVLPVNDAVVLSTIADVTLFVARQNKVSLSEVEEAQELFTKAGISLDGVVFNAFIPSRIRYGLTRYPYYAYRYGFSKYRRYENYNAYKNYEAYVQHEKPASRSVKVHVKEDLNKFQKRLSDWLTKILKKLRK